MYVGITGNWALVLKRDYFNKVAGGVRQQEKLDAHSELVKIRYGSHGPHQKSPCIGSARAWSDASTKLLGLYHVYQASTGHSHEWTRFVSFIALQSR